MSNKVLDFLNGGDHPYMDGWHCVNGHHFWAWLTIFLCFGIIACYAKISYHWNAGFRKLKHGLARSSFFNMMNIFAFCAVCGYSFLILFMWFPWWPLRALFLAVLFFFSAKYALNTDKLRVIYEEIETLPG